MVHVNLSSTFDFSGKTVLVTGASLGGIGTAVAEAFRAAGADAIITGLEDNPSNDLADRFQYFKLDVSDAASVENLTNDIDDLDILVNCAGISLRGREGTVEAFERTLDVNLTGTYRVCLAMLDNLKKSQGCIVNTASMYALYGSPAIPGYGASKSAVSQMTKSLAGAWAEHRIRVNAIAPGFIVTAQSEAARSDEEHYRKVIQRTPMGRWGEPDDLAGPVLYLCSDAASFVSGVTLPVDGGYSAV